MSKQHYFEPEFKKQIVQLYLQGRTIKSLNDEKISLEEIKRLRKELEELKKENAFLKKAAAFFAREID